MNEVGWLDGGGGGGKCLNALMKSLRWLRRSGGCVCGVIN